MVHDDGILKIQLATDQHVHDNYIYYIVGYRHDSVIEVISAHKTNYLIEFFKQLI